MSRAGDSTPKIKRAWLTLTAALALHVLDEALNDFLSVYNPAVIAIRESVPFLPLPTFTFARWLIGLTLAVVILSVLGWRAIPSRPWLRAVGYPFAVFMIFNALAHVAISATQRRLMPGTYSAPLLLVAAAYLFRALQSTRAQA